MVLCIWGFPNKIAALQFEYAWQHPSICRHTKGAVAELGFGGVSARGRQRMIMGTQKNMHVLLAMLKVLPYSRLPLQLHVLEPSANAILRSTLAAVVRQLPSHLSITCGTFADLEMACAERLKAIRKPVGDAPCGGCRVCFKAGDRVVACLGCQQPFHVRCAAALFHSDEANSALVPQGRVPCPSCQEALEWPMLIQTARRLSVSLAAVVVDEAEDEEEAEQSDASSGVEDDEDNMPLSQLGASPSAPKTRKVAGKTVVPASRRGKACDRRTGRPPSRGAMRRTLSLQAVTAPKRRRTAHTAEVPNGNAVAGRGPKAPVASPSRAVPAPGKESSLRNRLHQRPGGDQLTKCLQDVVLCTGHSAGD